MSEQGITVATRLNVFERYLSAWVAARDDIARRVSDLVEETKR